MKTSLIVAICLFPLWAFAVDLSPTSSASNKGISKLAEVGGVPDFPNPRLLPGLPNDRFAANPRGRVKINLPDRVLILEADSRELFAIAGSSLNSGVSPEAKPPLLHLEPDLPKQK
jgi:hypothetical protein